MLIARFAQNYPGSSHSISGATVGLVQMLGLGPIGALNDTWLDGCSILALLKHTHRCVMMCVCMYINICMHIYINMYADVLKTYLYIYIYMHLHLHIHIYTVNTPNILYTHIYIYTLSGKQT